MDEYNKCPAVGPSEPPHHLSRTDVKDLASPIWQHLGSLTPEPDVPVTLKRKAIDTMHLHQRAKEEVSHTKSDMSKFMTFLQGQLLLLSEKEQALEQLECTRHIVGCMSLIKMEKCVTQNMLESVKSRFEPCLSEPGAVSATQFVRDFLLAEEQRERFTVNNGTPQSETLDIEELLHQIEELEAEHENEDDDEYENNNGEDHS